MSGGGGGQLACSHELTAGSDGVSPVVSGGGGGRLACSQKTTVRSDGASLAVSGGGGGRLACSQKLAAGTDGASPGVSGGGGGRLACSRKLTTKTDWPARAALLGLAAAGVDGREWSLAGVGPLVVAGVVPGRRAVDWSGARF